MGLAEQIKEQLKKDNIQFILAQFVDVHGAAKAKMMPVSSYEDALDQGAGFAGAAVWGMGQGPHSHDMLASIDPESYTPMPAQAEMPGVARFASDLYVDGQPYPYCPRVNLKRVLAKAKEEGYVFNVGIEPEHFLVVRNGNGEISPWDPDGVDCLAKPCYDFRGMAPAIAYLQDLTAGLNQLGYGVYQCDHEDGNGQFEVNFGYSDALTTADRHTFFKMYASQVAKKYGAIATFMPKPFAHKTGSGAHIHYHLADAATGKSVFEDISDPRGLGHSRLAYHFIGGILEHAEALCAVTSPTVNCYKRLQVGPGLYSSQSGFTWTPAFISYGDNNRTQMVRSAGPGHFEDRTVSAAVNPYLAFAAYLEAGLDGIRRKLEPGEPNIGNLYELGLDGIAAKGVKTLPQSLHASLTALEEDHIVRAAMGPIYEAFVDVKRKEWKEYRHHVTQWEVNQYLTAI